MDVAWRRAAAYVVCRDEAGTTDAVRWFDLDELASLPHVELVDFVVDLLAERSNPSVPALGDEQRRMGRTERDDTH
jgi:hypothetical protein